MTEKKLLKLINKGENQTVSLKSLKAKPSVLARPMVSFSNTNDGIIIIGVDDKTRKVFGAKTTKQKEEGLDNIHNASKQCCQPNVDISKIEEIKTANGVAFVVSISKDPDEVYVTEGAALIRKGTMDIKPSNYDIQLLFSKRNKLKFEEEIVDGATLEDIDFKKISKFRNEYFKNRKKRLSGEDMDIMRQFGCIKRVDKKDIPTVTGIVCFGKIPQQFFSLDYIHIFRYGAPEKDSSAKMGDNYIDKGTVSEMIREAYEYIVEELNKELIPYKNPATGRREYIPKYPYLVIREAIANAVTHKEYHPFIRNGIDVLWFSDRIEILNPGLLLDPITPENIYLIRNKQRNSNIARILTGYGYVEQIGEGMQLFKRECDNHPLRPKYPEYREWVDTTVTVLYPAEVGVTEKQIIIPEKLNGRQLKALEHIKLSGKISNRAYREIFRVSAATAKRELGDLVGKGICRTAGAGRSLHYILK
ncbi:MAG: RNA-binding domain-containing protein [Candidatus Omnitrophota bacterium]